jgi:hypothetical protein
MSLRDVARDKGQELACTLKLRKSSERVSRQHQRAFDAIISALALTPEAPALPRLEDVKISRPQKALALLELAWRVPIGTRLEHDVVLLISRCYVDAEETWRLRIRDELRDRQVHPFSNVRHIVHLVRQVDRVDDVEVAELGHLDRGYADVRVSIAERVILHEQVEHLDAVITYLSRIYETKGLDSEEESSAARRLFNQLALKFKKDAAALRIFYPRYLALYEREEPRGFLMLALAGYGDELVPMLVFDHDSSEIAHLHRTAIEHALAHIVTRGGVKATLALLAMLRDARPPQLGRVCKFLSKALTSLASQVKHAGADAVRRAVFEAVPMLERRPMPEIRQLLEDFKALDWGGASIEPLIARVLAGTVTNPERHQLRRLAGHAVRQLMTSAEDGTRALEERVRALEALSQLHAAPALEPARRLWEIFMESEFDELRVAVLRTLGALQLDPGPEAREALFELTRTGPAEIASEIRAGWSRMFRAVSLDTETPRERSKP